MNGKPQNEQPRFRWLRRWLATGAVLFLCLLILSHFLPNGPRTLDDWTVALILFALASLVIAAVLLGLGAAFQVAFSRRNLGRTVFGLACLVTIIALFYAEEDWRGWRAWKNYVAKCDAAGETMDWEAYIPPAIPDDQNLALCPLFKPILDYTTRNDATVEHTIWNDTNGIARIHRLLLRLNDGGAADRNNPRHRQAEQELDENGMTNGWINLVAWQNYFRTGTNLEGIPAGKSPAQDVLLGLRFKAADLAGLQIEAARRPLSRWPVHYETEPAAEILLPHLADVRGIVQTLQLRAAARLAAGDTDGGLADIRLGFRLIDSIATEPFLISQLVRLAAVKDLQQPIREGLARRQFSDAQLAELEHQFATLDLLSDFRRGLLVMRAMNSQWTSISSQTFDDFTVSSKEQLRMKLLMRLAPKGWMYQNELALCRLEDETMLRAVDARQHLVLPGPAGQTKLLVNAAHGPFSILTKYVFSPFATLDNTVLNAAHGQAVVDQTLVAIALERYRLAHGEFPEALDALAPQFIAQVPHDVIGGQPLHYRRTSDGQFILYSVGWNETDDGGATVLRKGSTGAVDLGEGDWVWKYPAR